MVSVVSSEVNSEVSDVCVSCVMAQDGSIYFAPWGATKVLRIKAEGIEKPCWRRHGAGSSQSADGSSASIPTHVFVLMLQKQCHDHEEDPRVIGSFTTKASAAKFVETIITPYGAKYPPMPLPQSHRNPQCIKLSHKPPPAPKKIAIVLPDPTEYLAGPR